jgi:peptidoglycan/LPS O-acetylase OafA/YrhL
MLSGFILAHVYLGQITNGSFSHGAFIKNRIARIYPMHLATLAASIILLFLINMFNLGTAQDNLAEAGDLPAYILMLHAWGVIDSLNFNYPSWSISAEWFAYLFFPLFMAPAIMLRAHPLRLLAAGLALLALAAWLAPLMLGERLTELTWKFGILRIIPEFFIGIGLYMLGRHSSLAPLASMSVFSAALGLVFVNSALDGSPVLSIPLFALVILASADMARNRAGLVRVLESRPLVYLGEISYSIYLVHALLYTVWFKGMDTILGLELAGQWQFAIWLASFPLVVIAAMAGYHLIEVPGRRFVKGLSWPFRAAPLADGARQ